MTPPLTVAISFARSAYKFAEEIAQSLMTHGFRVISDDHRLGKAAETWGVHKFTLIEQTVNTDVAFCIVLLTPDFLTERWASYRHCRLIEATQARKGFILPVRIGDHSIRLRGVTDLLGELTVREDEAEKVVRHFMEKTSTITEVIQDAVGGYSDTEGLLHLYNPRLELIELDSYQDRAKRIGYELYEARDALVKRSTYFLHLYRGINLSATSEHVLKQHGRLFKTQSLIVLMPKEPQQTQRNRRLENVQSLFEATNTFYIDQFLWEQCTDDGFRSPEPLYELQTFIDPHVDQGTGRTALAEIDDWSRRESAPVLIVQGSGGIGKTTLAKAFANLLIECGSHRVFFIDAYAIIRYILQHIDLLRSFDLYHAYLAYVYSENDDGIPDGVMGPDLFRANFGIGNITIILDGLDEVISRFGGQFLIHEFLDSISEHPVEANHGKVLITCRTLFLESTEIDPNINTFELLPFDEPLATKYFERRFPGLPNTVDRGLRIARKLMRVGDQDAFIPFVLDVVSSILHEQIEQSDPFDDPSFISDILDSRMETDYIVGRVCRREELKYGQALSKDAQVRFFIHLAVSEGGAIIHPDRLSENLATAAPDHLTGRIEKDAMLNHPLLRADHHSITFRYDLLAPYFQALAVSQVLRDAAPLTPAVARVLAERTDSSFLFDCSVRFKDTRETMTWRLVTLIEELHAMGDSADFSRRAVSGLFLIGLYYLRAKGASNRESATELMKDLFLQNGSIHRLALRGPKERFVFNFSGLTFDDCLFSGYDSFWECTFDRNTYFRNSELLLLHLPDGLNTSGTRANFELATCRTDDSVQRVFEHRSVAAGQAVTIRITDLVQFLKLFYLRGHMMPQREARLKSKYKGQTNFGTLVAHLRDHGFVENHVSNKNTLGPELAITGKFKNEAMKFCTEGTMSAKIKAIVKALPE